MEEKETLGPEKERRMKYGPAIVDQICDLYVAGEYTIKQLCAVVGIAEFTYYQWLDKHNEFSERIKEAQKLKLANMKELARTGLATLLQVKEVEETIQDYVPRRNGQPKLKAMRVVKRKVMPNVTAVMYVLNNQDSDNFRHRDARRDGDETGGGVTITIHEA